MTVVTIDADYPGGAAREYGKVSVKLIHAGAGGTTDDRVILDPVIVTLDEDGEGSIDLTPNDEITPDGTYYRFTFLGSSPSVSRTVRLTADTPDPVSLADESILVIEPDQPTYYVRADLPTTVPITPLADIGTTEVTLSVLSEDQDGRMIAGFYAAAIDYGGGFVARRSGLVLTNRLSPPFAPDGYLFQYSEAGVPQFIASPSLLIGDVVTGTPVDPTAASPAFIAFSESVDADLADLARIHWPQPGWEGAFRDLPATPAALLSTLVADAVADPHDGPYMVVGIPADDRSGPGDGYAFVCDTPLPTLTNGAIDTRITYRPVDDGGGSPDPDREDSFAELFTINPDNPDALEIATMWVRREPYDFAEHTEIGGIGEIAQLSTLGPVQGLWGTVRHTIVFDEDGVGVVRLYRKTAGAFDDETTDGSRWRLIGTVTLDAPTSLLSLTNLHIGVGPGVNHVADVQVYDGVDGDLICRPNIAGATDGATSLPDLVLSGATWEAVDPANATVVVPVGEGGGGGLSESEVEGLIDAALDALLDGAPGALNTLNELAAAVNDDASFAATVTTALAGKVPTSRQIAGLDLSADRSAAAIKTALSLAKADVGLGNVDNTADTAKPVSTAQQTALDAKVAKSLVDAKGDLLTATANDTPDRLAVGTDGRVLRADSNSATGLIWAHPTALHTFTSSQWTGAFQSAGAASGITSNRLYFLYFDIPKRTQFTGIAVNHAATSAGASSVGKLGIWLPGSNGLPDVLDYDVSTAVGTIDLASAAGFKSLTISYWANPGRIWVGFVAQITSGSPTFTVGVPLGVMPDSGTPPVTNGTKFQASVSGSLPNPAVPGSSNTTSPPNVFLQPA